MDKRTQAAYTKEVYLEALRRFGIPPDTVKDLGGFVNYVYEYTLDGKAYILRISHSLHLPPDRTRGELDFLAYLAANDLRVPQPRMSLAGELVEVIEAPLPDSRETSYFSAVSFDKAPGDPASDKDWVPELFEKMGHFMGRLHALSVHYQPSRPEFRRHEWYEDEEDYAERYLPEDEHLVKQKFYKLIDHLRSLPHDPKGYGLSHIDFHTGNFFLEDTPQGKQITLFDWDDCAYAPFVYDIAMALFYAVPHHCDKPGDLRKARLFYQTFLHGYLQEYPLDRSWLKEIPNFLKLREMDLYIIIHGSDIQNGLSRWAASFMKGRKQRLEDDVPYIDFKSEEWFV